MHHDHFVRVKPLGLAEKGQERTMQHFKRVAEQVELHPFLKELDESRELWLADTSRQRKVRCQRNTQNIFLRAAKKPLPPGARNANDVHESRKTRFAAKFPDTLAFCENAASQLGGELGRATLVALLPKSRVYPHIDAGDYYRVRDRFHLVLKSSQGSPLSVEEETAVMRPGELWVFNNKARHWAENLSEDSRVHLIFDILPASGKGFYAFSLEEASSAKV